MALALALYGIHRLVTLELGTGQRATARLAVQLDGLCADGVLPLGGVQRGFYLALSVWTFWWARQGRWGSACLLATLAAATRSAGIVLIIPLAVIYLYGPRTDRPADRGHAGWLMPRYRVRADAWWLALVPVGLGLFMGYLAASGVDALAPFRAQQVWARHLAGPYGAVWDGAKAAFEGVRQLLSGQRTHVYYPASGDPLVNAGHDLVLFAFLLVALAGVVGVLRRLPLAYGLYVLAALALPLTYPADGQPLMSLPRFLVVLFPLHIWLARVLVERRRLRAAVLLGSAALLGLFVAQFATWHWVA